MARNEARRAALAKEWLVRRGTRGKNDRELRATPDDVSELEMV